MKNFIRKGNWLDQASLEIRWIYSLFLLFALIGHLSFVLISAYRVGPGYDEIVLHYRGGDAEEEMAFPMEFVELLEVTHFHAYIEGIVLLVLAHLYVVVPHSQKTKLAVIFLSFGSTFLDLISPWTIRYLSPYAAYGQIFAWVGMSISYLPLTIIPLYYIWKK
ncbi:MAG: hypothetical protein ACE5J1_00555 [Nitrospiria bacterium]